MLSMALTPFRLFEVAQVVIPTACLLVSVTTLKAARTKYRRVVRSGMNGDVKRVRWMQYRSDAILCFAQFLFLTTACWRVFDRDPSTAGYFLQYVVTGIIRTVGATLIAVMTLLNKRDSSRLGHPEH